MLIFSRFFSSPVIFSPVSLLAMQICCRSFYGEEISIRYCNVPEEFGNFIIRLYFLSVFLMYLFLD